jgi:hypothetical protein
MPIRIDTDSHMPHITGSNISIPTTYYMNINDFYNGFGTAINGQGQVVSTQFPLPTVGSKYINYYFLPNLIGTYWEDIVLNDITCVKTTGRDVDAEDFSGWDLDKIMRVTYTWTNAGKKDIVTPGDQSSMKFDTETNTQLETTDLVFDVDFPNDLPQLASHLFFNDRNPDIIVYSTDSEGNPTSENEGPYDVADTALQRYHRENNDSPSHELYTTNTVLTVTAYSKNNYTYQINDKLNYINSADFLSDTYGAREYRLGKKNKQPTTKKNDIDSHDDTWQWRFHDYTKTESGIDLYKYEMVFHFKVDTWAEWYGVEVQEYKTMNFFAELLTPLFNQDIP